MGLQSLTRKMLGTVQDVPVWTIFGAEGGESGGGDNAGADGGNSQDDADDEDDDDGDGGDGKPATPSEKKKLSSEAAARRRELRRVEKERDDLLAEKAEAERKKNDDLTNANNDITALTEKLSKRDTVLRNNLLDTGILKDEKRVWHDSDVVLAALDLSAIEVDLETGTVEGLSEELARVAKEKPFLVKETKGAKKKDDAGNGGTSGTAGTQTQTKLGSSGINPGGAGSQANQQIAQREALVKKFPALRK